MAVTPDVRRPRQKDQEFKVISELEAHLGSMKLCLNNCCSPRPNKTNLKHHEARPWDISDSDCDTRKLLKQICFSVLEAGKSKVRML